MGEFEVEVDSKELDIEGEAELSLLKVGLADKTSDGEGELIGCNDGIEFNLVCVTDGESL